MDGAYSLHGAVVALAAAGEGVVLAAHRGGALGACNVPRADASPTAEAGAVTLAAPGGRLTALVCVDRGDGSALALVGDSDGWLHAVAHEVRAGFTPRGAARLAATSLTSIAVQDTGAGGGSGALVAIGEGDRGGVVVHDLEALAGSGGGSRARWEGAAGGGAGPGVRTVRWWPHSAHTLLVAAGPRVVVVDTRAPARALQSAAAAALSLPALTSAPADGSGAITPPLVLDVLLSPGGDPWTAFGATDGGAVVAWDLRAPGPPFAASSPGREGSHAGPAWALAAVPPATLTAAAAAVVASAGEDGVVRTHALPARGGSMLDGGPAVLCGAPLGLRALIAARAGGGGGGAGAGVGALAGPAAATALVAAGDAGCFVAAPAVAAYRRP